MNRTTCTCFQYQYVLQLAIVFLPKSKSIYLVFITKGKSIYLVFIPKGKNLDDQTSYWLLICSGYAPDYRNVIILKAFHSSVN